MKIRKIELRVMFSLQNDTIARKIYYICGCGLKNGPDIRINHI